MEGFFFLTNISAEFETKFEQSLGRVRSPSGSIYEKPRDRKSRVTTDHMCLILRQVLQD
jgi:hypothetical protein